MAPFACLRTARARWIAVGKLLVLGWLASSLAVAERLTRRHGAPAGRAPEVEFAETEDILLEARDGAHVPG